MTPSDKGLDLGPVTLSDLQRVGRMNYVNALAVLTFISTRRSPAVVVPPEIKSAWEYIEQTKFREGVLFQNCVDRLVKFAKSLGGK